MRRITTLCPRAFPAYFPLLSVPVFGQSVGRYITIAHVLIIRDWAEIQVVWLKKFNQSGIRLLEQSVLAFQSQCAATRSAVGRAILRLIIRPGIPVFAFNPLCFFQSGFSCIRNTLRNLREWIYFSLDSYTRSCAFTLIYRSWIFLNGTALCNWK